MVILRATAKVLRALRAPAEPSAASDTALGDWYVNHVVVDRQPLLLITSSESLLSIVVRARGVGNLPSRLPEFVAQRLRDLGIPPHIRDAELRAMDPVVVARTASRSVLGTMNDFASSLPFYLGASGWDESVFPKVEAALGNTPCRLSSRGKEPVWPDQDTLRLLEARWGQACSQ